MAIKRKAPSEVSKRNVRPITSFFKKAGVVGHAGPKDLNTTTTTDTTFNKQEWINNLSPENKTLLKLEIETIDDSWFQVLSKEFTKPYFLNLKKFLKTEFKGKTPIFPPSNDIYSWTRLTPFDQVKIVILGQDPYHNFNQAHGLAFSVKPPTVAPPSLKNMYKALKIDYPSFEVPTTGELTKWAKQGVLLLNTCLTVRAHQANSHSGHGWETFTEKVISLVAEKKEGVVFMAWGNPAGKRVDKISSEVKKKHLILKSVHPSPLSASRGYFTCGHYKKSNEWLEEKFGKKAVIDWTLA